MHKKKKNISQQLVIASLQPRLKFFLSLFFVFLFLQEPWVGDKQTVAPSKDVLPCNQLPLQDKPLLFPLQGVLIPVHPNHRGEAHTQDFRGNDGQ